MPVESVNMLIIFRCFMLAGILSVLILCVSCNQVLNENVRKLSYYYNPGCDIPECQPTSENDTYLNLVHVEAIGLKDTLHYLFSTYKIPSVIIARTSKEASLNINWTNLLNLQEESITFSEFPLQSIGLLLTELWEFIDDHDEASMTHSSKVNALGLKNFNWKDINSTLQFSETLITTFPTASSNSSIFSDNGSFKIKFSVTGANEPSDEYPHLYFSGNSMQLSLFLNDFVPSSKESRFALEVMAVSAFAQNNEWTDHAHITIDDEYSPGVFKIVELNPVCPTNDSNCKSFITWKPVAYIGGKPTVANSSDAVMSKYENSAVIPPSIAAVAFNESSSSKISFNMTFGTSGDGFYIKTKYTSWSVMMGVGKSSAEKLSLAAIIVISVGLGAPLLIMLVGGIYLAYVKCHKKDDDLLLSQDSMN